MEKLETFGTQELSMNELVETDGGLIFGFNWGGFFRGVGIGAGLGIGAYAGYQSVMA